MSSNLCTSRYGLVSHLVDDLASLLVRRQPHQGQPQLRMLRTALDCAGLHCSPATFKCAAHGEVVENTKAVEESNDVFKMTAG